MIASPLAYCQVPHVFRPLACCQVRHPRSCPLACQVCHVSRPLACCQVRHPMSCPLAYCQVRLVFCPLACCQIRHPKSQSIFMITKLIFHRFHIAARSYRNCGLFQDSVENYRNCGLFHTHATARQVLRFMMPATLAHQASTIHHTLMPHIPENCTMVKLLIIQHTSNSPS